MNDYDALLGYSILMTIFAIFLIFIPIANNNTIKETLCTTAYTNVVEYKQCKTHGVINIIKTLDIKGSKINDN